MRASCAFVALISACGGRAATVQGPTETFTATAIALPGGGPDGVAMDYLAFDPRTNTVWAPAGNTGAIDVVDVATGKVAQIGARATQELEIRGRTRRVGPSAAAIGPAGTVYVGSRGDRTICAFDEAILTQRTCVTLDAMPDGVAYVARTQEVWVTTPRDRSIRVLDATSLAQKARIAFDGAPEGFAADNVRGRFYTNLEDKDQTLAIDLTTRQTVATWVPHCDDDGPHGLRLAEPEGFLLVACDDRISAFDVARGAQVGSIDTGDGVDDFDYAPATHRIYAGGAEAGSLTIASLAPTGAITKLATVATRPGARNGVVTAAGQVYLAHTQGSELVVVTPVEMSRAISARSVALLLVLSTSVASAEPVRTKHRAAHLAGLGVAVGAFVLSETVAKDALSPDACRWCNPPGFDASIRSHLRWSHPDTAATLSNVTGFVLSPLTATALLFASSSDAAHWQTFGDDMLAVAEAATYTQLAVQAIKFSVGRQRPFAHYAPAGSTAEDNLSFLSGHSALAFSIAVAAGSVAERRHTKLAPAIWAVGLGLAAATAYFRVAGDKHYLTDVLAGSALGAAGGFAIPRITGALPDDLVIAPSPNGIAILGSF